MPYARIIPRHVVLVGIGELVLLCDVVTEDDIREHSTRVVHGARNIDSDSEARNE